MANELNINLGQTGLTVTANTYLAGSLSTSDISCGEIGATGAYSGNMTGTTAGTYQVVFFANSSTVSCGGGSIIWDGTREITANYANVEKVHTYQITGTGQPGNPWGPS